MKVLVKFLKSPIHYRIGQCKGSTAKVDEKLAVEMKKTGHAIIVEKTELPNTVPGKQTFEELGYSSIEEILKISDFSEIEGLTEAEIKKLNALKET